MIFQPFTDKTLELAVATIITAPAAVHAAVDGISNADTPEWVGSLTQISAFGLVAWIVWYMFSKWLPQMQANQVEQLNAQRDAHVEAMKELAGAHRAAIESMTLSFTDNLKQQRVDLLAMRAYCKAATPNHD
jgi:hypothetical protein